MTWVGSGGWLPKFWHIRNLVALYSRAENLTEVLRGFDALFDAITHAETEAYKAGMEEGRKSERPT